MYGAECLNKQFEKCYVGKLIYSVMQSINEMKMRLYSIFDFKGTRCKDFSITQKKSTIFFLMSMVNFPLKIYEWLLITLCICFIYINDQSD